ncbi:DNA/RNA non-specific endonuclease [Parenemella sanctibonifatiensis]|uniref:Type VII secretion system protein EssD-like domain-containing protein n=1 Tax=Parenemella sanctibonifatiensis TaxID=2016505 RepID=A0A255EHN0_9ACTN|nr:DNA/RNA non-specific endonuclease [Parenemella sanctibonifatiensis]OYN86536.1 hypothetical protein CGZ92_09355 [Parenemella sanctibonifatiensis]OYN91028.1 hypothetical protein CGZ91_06045 [Parenemella sanctibonifatiensis]
MAKKPPKALLKGIFKKADEYLDHFVPPTRGYRPQQLKPNQKYTAGEFNYKYETDDLGRIKKAEADKLQLTKRDDRLSHQDKTPGKRDGDHAGHVFGDRFGGSPEVDNLLSQAADVNLGSYKKLENEWADALEAGKDVKVKVEPKYDGDGMRPTEFKVNYTVTPPGKVKTEVIKQ